MTALKTVGPLVGAAVLMSMACTLDLPPAVVVGAMFGFLVYAGWALLWLDLSSVWPPSVWRAVRAGAPRGVARLRARAGGVDPDAAALSHGSWG